MSFRTVVITKHCKCSFKNDYMIVKDEKIQMIHLSEINSVIFETPAISVTGVLLSELAKRKVNIVFCDERHFPQGQYTAFDLNYMTAARISVQADWDSDFKLLAWQQIIRQKIAQQGNLLMHFGHADEAKLLESYVDDITPGDETNREGFAAKVYFNALFEEGFVRHDSASQCNACLDYGYTILLSMVAREIVRCGYSTALGIHHKGVFNSSNLACDIMEPFRPIVDYIVLKNYNGVFDKKAKEPLWNLGNTEIFSNGKRQYLSSFICDYVLQVCHFIENGGGFLPDYTTLW